MLFYAFGDSPPFRIAVHLFIGVAAGYSGGVAWHSIIRPYFIDPLSGQSVAPISPFDLTLRLILVILLLTKISSRTAFVGNPVGAYLVGIGAASAIGGAIKGTIFPLTSGASGVVPTKTIQLLFGENISDGPLIALRFIFTGVILVGTISTLMFFHFSAKSIPNQTPIRNRFVTIIAWIGQGFIAITFGVLFAGVYIASLDAIIERLIFLWSAINTFFIG
jgi:hypothetical protein